MKIHIILSFALALMASGCLSQTTRCLETPVEEGLGKVEIDRCSRAMDSNPRNQALFEHYMALLRVEGRYVEIVSWSQRVLEADPERSDALYHLAVGLRKDGQCEAAVARYRQYALKRPEEADPYFGMALCFEEIGDRLAAQQAYGTYAKKENRPGQEEWIARARERLTELEAGGALATKKQPAEPKPPVEEEGAPGEPPRDEPEPAHPDPEPEPEPVEPEPEPVDPEPAPAEPEPEPVEPEPAPVEPEPAPAEPEPAPEPEPKPAPAPPAGESQDCSAHEKDIKADPFNTAAYERFATCSLGQKQYKQVVDKLKVGVRDNPGFHRGWFFLGEGYTGVGDANQAKFAYSKACKKGVSEACNK